jgi:hypothetical protein
MRGCLGSARQAGAEVGAICAGPLSTRGSSSRAGSAVVPAAAGTSASRVSERRHDGARPRSALPAAQRSRGRTESPGIRSTRRTSRESSGSRRPHSPARSTTQPSPRLPPSPWTARRHRIHDGLPSRRDRGCASPSSRRRCRPATATGPSAGLLSPPRSQLHASAAPTPAAGQGRRLRPPAGGRRRWRIGHCFPGDRRTRRNSCALRATTIVEALINTAPTAGLSVTPAHANTPAASGIASTL